ncbi:MAG: hypothetical protein ACREOU_10195 [Candidatus Eiseniibacteriota bacterium]
MRRLLPNPPIHCRFLRAWALACAGAFALAIFTSLPALEAFAGEEEEEELEAERSGPGRPTGPVPLYGYGPRLKGPKRMSLEELEELAAQTFERRPVGRVIAGFGPPPGYDWVSLGPRPILDEFWSGGANASGRVSAIAVDPRNAQVAYLAGAQGGVWKTTDGGTSWAPLTDGLSSLSSGALALDPANPDVVYYATGEQHYSIDSFYGDGVFRSNNGGADWFKVASITEAGSYIARVGIAPDNSDVVYLASSAGFVRTNNGGTTWEVTLSSPGRWCNDLAVDPVKPGVVYAALYRNGVYRSDDYGTTWTLMSGGMPTAGFERVNLALAPSEPDVLYASLVDSVTSGLFGMYRTANGGLSWTKLTATPNYLGGQGWYDNTLVVHPNDANTVVAGGVYPYSGTSYGVIRSTNGGASWTDITFGPAGNRVHPDQHFLTYGPDLTLWIANDGGVWRRPNGGTTWINCNSTLSLTQFYTVAQSPTDPDFIVGGTQDNGSVRYAGSDVWPQVIAGDGGPVAFRLDNPTEYFTTYVRMKPVYKWSTSGAYLGDVTGPWQAAGDRADWCTGPLVGDPNFTNTLYAGTYRVWRTANGGGSWTATSFDLTGGSGVLRAIAPAPNAPGTIYASSSDGRLYVTVDLIDWQLRNAGLPSGLRLPKIAVDPANSSIAYVIADRSSSGRVYRTTNQGVSWTSITGTLPVGLRPFSLAVDFRTAPPRLHVGTDYGVYVSVDQGATWIKVDAGLPDVATYDLALDPVHNLLVAATHGRGIYRTSPDLTGPSVTVTSPAGGEMWAPSSSHLITWNAADAAGVDSVTILLSIDGGASYDSTVARGIPNAGSFDWTTPHANLPDCKIRIVAWDGWRNSDSGESPASFAIVGAVAVEDAGAGTFRLHPAWPNPGRPPIRLRYTVARSAPVSLELFDLAGHRVRTLVSENASSTASTHEVTWDGRDQAGRPVGPGIYFARFRAGDFEGRTRFAILP